MSPSLCGECQFFYYSPGAWYNEYDTDWDCEHPLESVSGNNLGMYGDCWGFRPKRKLQEVLDEMGITVLDAVVARKTWEREQDMIQEIQAAIERDKEEQQYKRFVARLVADRMQGRIGEREFRTKMEYPKVEVGGVWEWE